MRIYKILRLEEWATLRTSGRSAGASVDVLDGFVHFSASDQVKATLNKHFRKDSELMLLACESDAMGDCLRWEPARGGDMFPHLYRDLLLSDVIWTRLILPGPDGHDVGILE